jgi:hypothetical protein
MPQDSVIGHAAVAEALSVAAANAATPDTIENFSSRGPATIIFPSQQSRQVPNITGVDTVQTKVGQLGYFTNPFAGTSAAAPHVAAIAALVWAAKPSLTASGVVSAITSSSVDLSSSGWDNTWGFGRADAYAALASLAEWGSYSDSAHQTACDSFENHTTQNTVYMYGTGFAFSSNFRVVFWDQVSGTWYSREIIDCISTSDGRLGVPGTNLVAHTFTQGTDTDGNWHCIVYDGWSYTPSSYDAGDSHLFAEDTSYSAGNAFYVAPSALPEFSSIIGGIAVTGACAVIYYLLRKKKRQPNAEA